MSDTSAIAPRIPPLRPEDLDESFDAVIAELVTNQNGDLRPRRRDDPIGEFMGVMLRHPDLCRSFTALGTFLIKQSAISALHKELITLRTAWLCRCPFQWFHHVKVIHYLGRSAEDVEAIVAADPDGEVWGPAERVVLALVDSLHERATISDELWQTLGEHFDDRERMELIAHVGSCHSVSFMLNSLNIVPADGGLETR